MKFLTWDGMNFARGGGSKVFNKKRKKESKKQRNKERKKSMELHNPVHTVWESITDDLRIRPLQILQTRTVAFIRPGR